MKKIFTKTGVILVPLILCAALAITAFLSLTLIDDLRGNARVINYVGIVRGATQRLVKQELNREENDALIRELDDVLYGLSNGSEELNLIKLNSNRFQAQLSEMRQKWEAVKTEIYAVREGADSDALYAQSEEYFDLANQTVFTAEEYSEQTVQSTRKILIITNSIFIAAALLCAVLLFLQENRRKKLIEAEKENIKKSEQLSKRARELLAPMNEISELMYVADLETYDLLFINEAGKKIFKVDDGDANLKCYKVLYGYDEPCPFCTNHLLKKDETHSWEHTNQLIKKHHLLKDRLIEWDGKIAKMGIAFDITEANDEKNELKRRLERDNVCLNCVRELYHNHDIGVAISKVLERIGQLFAAERTYIITLEDNTFSITAEWCNENVAPLKNVLQKIPLAGYRGWMEELDRNKNVVIDDSEQLKDTIPAGYELLRRYGIQNLIWVPLKENGVLKGCIGIDNKPLDVSDMAIPFLQTIQYFVSLTMQRNENESMLFHLSHTDKLTSFNNRNCFIEDVGTFERRADSVGAVYLDVNGLKEINDGFGHDAGDKLIKECAEIIKKCAASEHLYRVGGDEFVILSLGIGKDAFYDNVQRLKDRFEDSQCHVAIGCKWSESCETIQEIIKIADELMYEDKRKFYLGFHTQTRYRHNNDLLNFLGDPEILNEQIAGGRFKVFLQSKIDVTKHTAAGAEALVRYLDETGRIVSPDKFVPVLENTYFISKIDYFVFEEVCRMIRKWLDEGKTPYAISSNFSKVTFMDDNFVKRLIEISDAYRIPREYLEIEITESASFTNFELLIARINQIKSAGFKISMDDFGIESSNLALLSVVNFDVLKIDKKFIEDIASNQKAQIIVQTMTKMCREMGIQLVAEGVENERQLEILESHGVNTVQGFLFSKPIPVAEYEEKYLQ